MNWLLLFVTMLFVASVITMFYILLSKLFRYLVDRDSFKQAAELLIKNTDIPFQIVFDEMKMLTAYGGTLQVITLAPGRELIAAAQFKTINQRYCCCLSDHYFIFPENPLLSELPTHRTLDYVNVIMNVNSNKSKTFIFVPNLCKLTATTDLYF